MPVADPVSAFQPAEVWSYNGVQLNQPWMNITTFGGARYNLPTLRGQNYQVPFRAGQLNRQKWPDQRTLTLTMWVDGTKSASGAIVGDPRLQFNNYWQQLRNNLWNRAAGGSLPTTLTRNWYITQAGVNGLVQATAIAEIAGSMDPTMNGRLSAVASIDFLLADPYFYGNQRSQAISTAGGTITTYGEGTVGEGFPSAVAGFTVQVTANTTVNNTTAGAQFTFNSALCPTPVTFPVTLDVLRDTAVDAAGNNQIAGVTHAGSRMWTCLVTGANAITNTAGTATFTFNDAYV